MKTKVAVSLLTSGQEFQLMQAEDARSAARLAGIDVEVVFAENNAIEQIHQIYSYVHAPEQERPTAIVVEAVSPDGMERLARNAVKAGIGWVAQQRKAPYLVTLSAENPKVPVVSVSVDEEEVGRIQARQIRRLLPGGGAVILIQGPMDSATATLRYRGMLEGLERSAIEVKKVLSGDWTSGSAAAAVRSWLRLKTSEAVKIDMVASQNDSMASGARSAILELRKDWAGIPFTGCDGLPEGGQRMVASRQLAATIVKPTTTGPAIELIARWLGGQPVPPELVLQPRSYPPLEQVGK